MISYIEVSNFVSFEFAEVMGAGKNGFYVRKKMHCTSRYCLILQLSLARTLYLLRGKWDYVMQIDHGQFGSPLSVLEN